MPTIPAAFGEGAERGDLPAAIARLTEDARTHRDPATLERLVRLRRAAFDGTEPMKPAQPGKPFRLPIDPKTRLAVATPGLLAGRTILSGIESTGCLLVRELFDEETVQRLTLAIERAFQSRERSRGGATDPETRSSYHELEDVRWGGGRAFLDEAAILAADSPSGFFDVMEAFTNAGVIEVVAQFMGERPALSVEKTVLRRASPLFVAAWHQDGAFLGTEIRSLNVWVPLSPCGRDAPSLEFVPRRVDHLLPTGHFYDWDIADVTVAEQHPLEAVLPEFDPGDALFFDHLFVHRTGITPWMKGTRYGLESWFFAPSAFPSPERTTGLYV